MNEEILNRLAESCRQTLDLNHPLSDEYYYAHLACCVLDAVFSIGVRYASTRQVVIRYCQAYDLNRLRPPGSPLPDPEQQEPLSRLVERIEAVGPESFAHDVLANRQRTSTRSGLLKTEAVLRFARVLTAAGIETFQDLLAHREDLALEAAIRSIPGQTSGVSWRYFWMLAGDEEGVKPDRMILGFLQQQTGRSWSNDQAVAIVQALCRHPLLTPWELTPRRLDHAIWNWQRTQS
ncbi:MAG: hypothetical protein U1D69_04360 [Polynucleobacter sp.]|nr:hypothetical protein [Polynucleobacter sp.]